MDAIKKQYNLESDGDISKEVENVLQKKGVKRQAYHSNSFVGNHCHKILEVRFKSIFQQPIFN